MLAVRPDYLSSIPGATQWTERNDSRKFSSGHLHKHHNSKGNDGGSGGDDDGDGHSGGGGDVDNSSDDGGGDDCDDCSSLASKSGKCWIYNAYLGSNLK